MHAGSGICCGMDYPIQAPGQLSSHLRSLRKAKGLSQAQLGALLGVGQTRIARIERDPASISVDQFLAILQVLGARMVLRRDDEPDPARPSRPRSAATGRRAATDEPW